MGTLKFVVCGQKRGQLGQPSVAGTPSHGCPVGSALGTRLAEL